MGTLLEELPGNWKITTLGAINTRKATTLAPKKFADETFEYYSIPDYQRDQRPSFTTGSQVESSKLLLEPKTILFGKLNPRVEKVWRVAATPEFRQIGSTEWLPVLPSEDIDSDFLYFLEWSDYVMPVAKTLVSGSTPSRQRVDPKSFYKIKVPLPPLPEQKKIAHVLSTVQRAIEAQERIIQTTTELKKTLMHKLFTEGLHNEPQKQTEIGPVPESWEVSLLGNSLSVAQYGLSVKGTTKGDYPILRMTNQVDGQIIGNNLQFVKIGEADFKKFKVEKGDILFNRTNSLDLVGRTAIHGIDGNYVFASYLIRLRTDRKKLNPFFLNLYFNRDETQSRLKSIATRAVSQSNISATKLKGFPIPLPSTKEQTKIVTQTEAIETKLLLHRRKLESLQDLFRTLLHELMTAEIRVREIEIT